MCPGVSWGASGRLVNAVATAGVVVHATIYTSDIRPTDPLAAGVESPSRLIEEGRHWYDT